jgi:spermidine synthase
VYLGAAGALALDGGGATSVALRFGLAALVLLIPTTLMGGTLPVLTRAMMADDRAQLKPALGRLYGLNTIGAVAGTALAGFFLIEYVGVRASLWLTAAINIALGAAAIRIAQRLGPTPPAPPSPLPAPRDLVRTLALVLLGVTAFASLLDEIAWTRVLVMIVGGSTYAFTLILLVFLLGIGLGSALVARRSASRGDSAVAAALAQGLTGVGAAALFLFFGVLPAYIVAVFQIPELGAVSRLLLMGVAVGGVVFVPALGMGMTFPLLADLTARADEARGADVGLAYALNTVGSILGAVLTGFVFVVALGTQTTLRVGLVANGLAALALAWIAARGIAEGSSEHGRLQVRVVSAGVLAMLALVAAAAAPGWSTRLVDLGPTIYARQRMDAASRRIFLEHRGVRQVAFREGWNATVSVWDAESGRSLRVNGKIDASDHGDMDTQIMLGLAPAAARTGATSALVIGFGSGVTTRVLADVPGMTRVRVVEIEPAVLAMDSLFHHVNASVLSRPTVAAVVDDARSALQLRRDRFDVIVSEPSNPWVAGVATLYTPEFFRIVRDRLSDDGVFCQWVQLYQLPLPIVAGIVRNVRAVFPHVQVWFGESHDLMVLASPRPFAYDPAWVARLVGPGGSSGELAREWLGIDRADQYDGRLLLGEAGVARLMERATFEHTDDRPRLEFQAARRFLDPGAAAAGVFDSLVAIAGWDSATSLALTRTFTARRTDPGLLPYVEAAQRAEPLNLDWAVRAAAVRVAMGDTSYADSALARVLARSPRGDAFLARGMIAAARGAPTARALLRSALAAGGDTAQARAALAMLAGRDGRWQDLAAEARGALAAARGTFRHPFPTARFLTDALSRLAFDGPAPLADSVLGYAIGRRPASARYLELRAVAALRAGDCEAAASAFVQLLEFGIRRDRGPALVRDCRGVQR